MDLRSKMTHPVVLPDYHNRQELEDAYGILNYAGTRVRIRRRPFAQRIRGLPQCKQFHSFFYVGWVLFLTCFVLLRVLWAFHSTTADGITKGIGLILRPFRVTTQDVVAFQNGNVIRDSASATVLDPAYDGLMPILLQKDGSAWIHGQQWSLDDAQTLCDNLELYVNYRKFHVGIMPARDTTFQDVVSVLDGLESARIMGGCPYPTRALLVSP